MRYFFRVEYDGTAYGGWQYQPNAPSIQAALAAAFSMVTRYQCSIIGAGRTDAGVHARGQGAHVDLPDHIDFRSCAHSVNAVLPADIGIYAMQPVADSFHARYSALSRRYRYTIIQRKKPLMRNHAWFLHHRVDWDILQATIPHLMGQHDFSAFCSTGSNAKTGICTVRHVSLEHINDDYVFEIEANRFIYKMVRTIVGTLIDIGTGKSETTMEAVIRSKNRACAGETAPACGLVLENVGYPPFIAG